MCLITGNHGTLVSGSLTSWDYFASHPDPFVYCFKEDNDHGKAIINSSLEIIVLLIL